MRGEFLLAARVELTEDAPATEHIAERAVSAREATCREHPGEDNCPHRLHWEPRNMNVHDANAFRYMASVSEQLAADAAERATFGRYEELIDRCTFNVECARCRTRQTVRVPERLASLRVICYRCGHKTPLELTWP